MPVLRQVLFTEERVRFRLPVERYREWVVLGLRRGRFRFALGPGAPDVCRAGEWVICPPGVELHRAALEPVVFYFARFRWKPADKPFWRGKKTPVDLARLGSTLDHLQRLAALPGSGLENAWAGHLLADLLYQCRHEIQRPEGGSGSGPDRLMRRAAQWLQVHVEAERTLEELAEELHISPFQLSRRFRAAWGLNPAAYRTRLRVGKARRLLVESNWTTERVAEACGFENAFYFSRVFSRETGFCPREFRRAHRF